jgi:hypothetical protein
MEAVLLKVDKKIFFTDQLLLLSQTGRVKRLAEPSFKQLYLKGSISNNYDGCLTNGSCASSEYEGIQNEDRKKRSLNERQQIRLID